MKNTTINKTRLFSNIPISYSFFDKKNFVIVISLKFFFVTTQLQFSVQKLKNWINKFECSLDFSFFSLKNSTNCFVRFLWRKKFSLEEIFANESTPGIWQILRGFIFANREKEKFSINILKKLMKHGYIQNMEIYMKLLVGHESLELTFL